MERPLTEYRTLLSKYYGLVELTDAELNEAIENLSAAIENIESAMDYIKAQKVMRDRINCWIENYGDLYGFNCNCPQCCQLANELNRLTTTMMNLDYQALIASKNACCCLKNSRTINHQSTTLKRKYDTCIQPNNGLEI